jgi:hypothetical protein
MLLDNKTIDNHSHQRKKLKFYAIMLKGTENNARIFLLRKRSKFYKLMLMHITRNGNLFHLKTKNYLTRKMSIAARDWQTTLHTQNDNDVDDCSPSTITIMIVIAIKNGIL